MQKCLFRLGQLGGQILCHQSLPPEWSELTSEFAICSSCLYMYDNSESATHAFFFLGNTYRKIPSTRDLINPLNFKHSQNSKSAGLLKHKGASLYERKSGIL